MCLYSATCKIIRHCILNTLKFSSQQTITKGDLYTFYQLAVLSVLHNKSLWESVFLHLKNKKNPGFGCDFHLLETIPATAEIQCADHSVLNILCERVFALLLYHNRQCFIFCSRYYLWGLLGLNSSPNLLVSSHAPLGNIMNQWQKAQTIVCDECDGWAGHRNPLVVLFLTGPQLLRPRQVLCPVKDNTHTHTL